jgi:putative heme-binding domain-containing protein
MQLAFSLGQFPSVPERSRLLAGILGHSDDAWIRTAVLSSVGSKALSVLESYAESRTNGLLSDPHAASLTFSRLAALAAQQSETVDDRARLADALRDADSQTLVMAVRAIREKGPEALSGPGLEELIQVEIEKTRIHLEGLPAIGANLTSAEVDDSLSGSVAVLSLSSFEVDGQLLLEQLAPARSPQMQAAALTVLLGFPDDAVARAIIARWSELSPALSAQAREALLSRPAWAMALLEALESGRVPATTLSPADLQRLISQPDAAVKARAEVLLAKMGPSPREDVLRAYQSVLALTGDIERGAAVFRQHCSVCHRVGDVGHEVGPKLETLKTRGPEFILTNVLDPNREVNPAWRDYIATTTDGVSYNGVVISETAVSITLRRSEAKETALARAEIDTLSDTGRSLMPEGLDKSIPPQAMADLIAWIMELN